MRLFIPLVLVGLVACGSDDDDDRPAPGTSPTQTPSPDPILTTTETEKSGPTVEEVVEAVIAIKRNMTLLSMPKASREIVETYFECVTDLGPATIAPGGMGCSYPYKPEKYNDFDVTFDADGYVVRTRIPDELIAGTGEEAVEFCDEDCPEEG